jgi:hypothetical protein
MPGLRVPDIRENRLPDIRENHRSVAGPSAVGTSTSAGRPGCAGTWASIVRGLDEIDRGGAMRHLHPSHVWATDDHAPPWSEDSTATRTAVLISILRATATLAAALVVLFAPGMARAENVDNRLLETYQPATHLDPSEQFRPASVQSFVADADLERLDAGSWTVVDPDPEPGELPGPGTGTWRLNQDSCMPTLPVGGLKCYAAAGAEGDGASVVYGRVFRSPGAIVLQYWYFYYDNTYIADPPTDSIWQAHEGDWEVVNVVLSEDEQPQFVGYSQHCRGQQRAWASTPTLDTHPIVYVAAGSHANYFSAGTHEIDIKTACPLPQQAIDFLQAGGYLPLFDRSFDGGEVAGPQEAGGTFTHIRAIEDGHPSWVAFPGFWGELQYVHAPPPIGTFPFGTSPPGPADHTIWGNPLGTMAGWPAG